jgi:hypothetical protein
VLTEVFDPVLIQHPARLERHPAWTHRVSADELAEEVGLCREIWFRSSTRYTQLQRRLPRVLTAVRLRQWQVRDRAASRLTVEAYHVARQLLTRIGSHNRALAVSDRAMETATDLGHLQLMAAAAWHFANALLHLGMYVSCTDYATAAADRISAAMPTEVEDVHLWGALSLLAAKGAAYSHDMGRAHDLFACVHKAAEHVADSSADFGISFGATDIAVARMEVALGRNGFEEAIRVAADVEIAADHPVTVRTRYHIALAHAFACNGEQLAATLALEKAADACPEELRYDHDAHRTLQYLIRKADGSPRGRVTRLAALAQLM